MTLLGVFFAPNLFAKEVLSLTVAPSNYISVRIASLGTCNTSFGQTIETQDDSIIITISAIELGKAICESQVVVKPLTISYNFQSSRTKGQKVIIKTEDQNLKVVGMDML